jgi:protein subunit release factor B
LKHLPTGIVVKYQDTRSRSLNRKNARRILQDRLEELEMGEDSRTSVKAREKSKKKASSTKKKRRKYKALEGGKAGEEGEEVEDGVENELEDNSEKKSTEIEAKHAAEETSPLNSGKIG